MTAAAWEEAEGRRVQEGRREREATVEDMKGKREEGRGMTGEDREGRPDMAGDSGEEEDIGAVVKVAGRKGPRPPLLLGGEGL